MLQKIGFQPGINKQVSETTAEGQWVDCDNVRFRYGTPEKIGGWNQLGGTGTNELTGAGRGMHHFINSLLLEQTEFYMLFREVYFTIYILLNLQRRLLARLPRPTDHQLLQ